jgi:hypothetical protein
MYILWVLYPRCGLAVIWRQQDLCGLHHVADPQPFVNHHRGVSTVK